MDQKIFVSTSTRRLLAAMAVAATAPLSAQADTIAWDGTAGDGFWTNGPQNTNATAFPNNGSQGANWTINAGSPGSIVTPSSGPGGNMIDYNFAGHDWTISSATISEDVQIKLDGGSLDVTNSNVSLLPTSANTTSNLSGLNLGQDGTPTIAVFTNSTVTSGRSNSNGNAFRVRNGSSLSLVGSTVNVTSETGTGHLTVEATSSLAIDGTSIVNVTGGLEVNSNGATVSVADGAELNLGWLRLNSGNEATQELMLTFSGGDITLNDVNPLRDNSSFEGAFNWVAPIGVGSITHTDLTTGTSNLASKITQGYFSIDGTRIDPTTVDINTDWTLSTNIDALNTELQSLAVNGKWLQLTSDGSEQTLTLVPEPGALALLSIGAMAVIGRRRRD